MSKARIFSIYVVLDLAIVVGVLLCVGHRWPVGRYLIPAAALFVLNGIWLIVMTVKHTPPRV
jgi:hypothetical protein